jgi:Mg2+-importing ATPase
MNFIKRFMVIFGLLSSIFDYITFLFLLYAMKVSSDIFRSAWFLEGLFTQILVILSLRTKKFFLKSKPSGLLLLTVFGVGLVGIIIPFTPLGKMLELRPLSIPLYLFVLLVVVFYLASVEIVKGFFYKRHDL